MSSKNHNVPDALLDSLLANYQKPEDLIGENGLLKQLTKLLVSDSAKMTHPDSRKLTHLG